MASVSSIYIYPAKDEPGQQLPRSAVSAEGLDGDRRKKHPLHLVSAEDYVESHPRANLVLDIDRSVLEGLHGRTLRIGSTTIVVTTERSECAGVHATVTDPGDVEVGDEVLVGDPA